MSCEQEGTEQDESIEDMTVGCLEALVAELLPTGNIEVKPAEAFAEVSGSNEDTASWGTLDNRYPHASTMSDTSGVSHEELEEMVMNLRKQSNRKDQVHVLKGSDHMEADQASYLGDYIFPFVTSQFEADFISWYFALKDCWTDSSLLPVQKELLYASFADSGSASGSGSGNGRSPSDWGGNSYSSNPTYDWGGQVEDHPTPWQYSLVYATPETDVRASERAAGWGQACVTVDTLWGTSAEPEAEEESEEEEYDSRLVPTQEELS